MGRSTRQPNDLSSSGWISSAGLVVLALSIAMGALSLPAGARAEPAAQGAAAEPPPSDVGLDQLLRLPSSYSETSSRRGGSAADGWRTRFKEARSDLANAKAALAKAQEELEHTASDTGQWSVSAPGASDPQNSPVSYKLRSEIREQRENVVIYERALRQLEVEADLKEVPLDWRD